MYNRTASTSTNLNYYTGLKLESKSHFYGRAAAEEVLASFYRALLRARSAKEVLASCFYERGARVRESQRSRLTPWARAAAGRVMIAVGMVWNAPKSGE